MKKTDDNIFPPEFFRRNVHEVALGILGQWLVRESPDGQVGRYLITEVEIYDGPEDGACHGRFGRTKRTEVMFLPGGVWYVYLIYGMYNMLNIVADDASYPAAVLLRGLKGINGPGRLTKALAIDRSYNGRVAAGESGLYIASSGIVLPPQAVKRRPRVGIDYAGFRWSRKPWRLIVDEKYLL